MSARTRRTALRLAVLGAAVVALGVLVSEAAMRPSRTDRVALYTMFAVVAIAAGGVAAVLRRWSRSSRSVRLTLLALAVASVAVPAVAIAGAGATMFIDGHDLRLVLVSLGIGVGLGIVGSMAVAEPLAYDLETLARTAEAVAAGRLDAPGSVRRADEVGTVARAMDRMREALAAAHRSRAQTEAERRRFLSDVTHDLRTPLAAIRANAEATEDGLIDPATAMAGIRSSVAALEQLVDDVATLATFESMELELEDVDLAELLDETAEAFAGLATTADVGLAVEVDGDLRIVASEHALRRLLRNLVDNALRHSPARGTVTIRAANRSDSIVIEVLDEGPGFSDAFAPHATERSARDDPARTGPGTGLGLAIVAAIVAAHGATMEIVPGPGGTVRIRLPRTGPKA